MGFFGMSGVLSRTTNLAARKKTSGNVVYQWHPNAHTKNGAARIICLL
jgi:hypothetical protein